MIYNTEWSLWEAFAKEFPYRELKVIDGHIWCEGHGWLARFDTDTEAINALKWAGYEHLAGSRYVPKLAAEKSQTPQGGGE